MKWAGFFGSGCFKRLDWYQVDDQQVSGRSGLRMTDDDPTDAQVGDHAGDHQETKKVTIRIQII